MQFQMSYKTLAFFTEHQLIFDQTILNIMVEEDGMEIVNILRMEKDNRGINTDNKLIMRRYSYMVFDHETCNKLKGKQICHKESLVIMILMEA
jgi:hypothetical protein